MKLQLKRAPDETTIVITFFTAFQSHGCLRIIIFSNFTHGKCTVKCFLVILALINQKLVSKNFETWNYIFSQLKTNSDSFKSSLTDFQWGSGRTVIFGKYSTSDLAQNNRTQLIENCLSASNFQPIIHVLWSFSMGR